MGTRARDCCGLLFLVVGVLVVGFPTRSLARPIRFDGALSLRISSFDPVAFAGAGVAEISTSPDRQLTFLSIPTGIFAAQHVVVPVTDPAAFPIAGIQVTVQNNKGLFAGTPGSRFGGVMNLPGHAKLCLFGGCSEPVANLTFPLSVVGFGGTGVVGAAVNLTVRGAPWTTGTVSAGGETQMGSAPGDVPGSLNVVTPIFISTNIGASAVLPAFAGLVVNLVGVACSDGIDDDGDGLTDFPDDPGCESEDDDSERDPALICDDGIDNDEDGFIDVPADPGCEDPTDASEKSETLACDDGTDNDGDGQSDFPNDPGCEAPSDTSEQGALACDDGTDNDGDGLADFPADPSCEGPADASEKSSLVCDDGVDNDDDGRVDFPADPGCDSLFDLSERSPNLVCEDGIDNDGDGLADYPADPGCASPADNNERSFLLGCDDGLDNDRDGLIDFPADTGCDDPLDPFELSAFIACDNALDDDGDGTVDSDDPGCSSPGDPSERASELVCDDGVDGDGDGLIDVPEDPGCDDPTDPSERSPSLVCDDGEDNDADGVADFPADPGCESATDGDERSPTAVCDDGVDNDGDGLNDHPVDPGCSSPTDPSERAPELACDDGVDGDGDGLIDVPDDPGCDDPSDPSERSPSLACDDGQDNDGDGLGDFPADPGCESTIDPDERSPTAICDDGIDNDADGLIDYPADPDCESILGTAEEHPALLDFAGLPNLQFVPQSYGDNTEETPHIGVSYGDAVVGSPIVVSSPSFSHGGLYDVLISTAFPTNSPSDNTPIIRVRFTAEPGYVVKLHSFDLGSYRTTGDNENVGIEIKDGANSVLFSQTGLSIQGGASHDTFSPGVSAQTLTLSIYTGTAREALALDNIRFSERAGPCRDGVDNDGDGRVDYPDDPGCTSAMKGSESPECQDGIDNDADGTLDFDGGASLNGGAPLGPVDPQCTQADAKERAPAACGLGAELVFAMPLLGLLAGPRLRKRVRRV